MSSTETVEIQVDESQRAQALALQQDVERGLAHLEEKRFDAAISAFKIALERAEKGTPAFDIVTHNLLTAYKGRISELIEAGEIMHLNRYLPEVAKLQLASPMLQDGGFRQRFADQLRNLALDLYGARQHEPALFFIRKALAYEKCPSYYIDLTNCLAWTKQPAKLSDFTTAFTEKDLGTHIFLACAPKSGSTFLKNVLQTATGFKNMFSVYAALQNEQEMDLPHLLKFGNQHTVTQQHARATEANIQMMQAFGIRPVVLTRNIFDTVASLLDFYTNGFVFSTFFDRDEFVSFGTEQKIDVMIEYVLPWYFQFVASWKRAEKEGRLQMMWLTYEEMLADKASSVKKILDFYRVRVPDGTIESTIGRIEGEKDKNRFNKGQAGRGDALLSAEQKDRITRLSRHFPSTVFTELGI